MNRKELQALTLVVPTNENPVQDPRKPTMHNGFDSSLKSGPFFIKVWADIHQSRPSKFKS